MVSLWNVTRFALSPLVLVGLMLAPLGLSACKDKDDPPPLDNRPPVPKERLPATSEAYDKTACWRGAPADYASECGYVTVPEDWSEPNGPQIRLAVARIFSNETSPAKDPVVYLEGGPGGAGVDGVFAGFSAFEPLLEDRDLVVFDQRGTGESEPSLACKELNDFDAPDPLGDCRKRLIRNGVELGAYDTAGNARDVDAIRKALGYDEWNLYGISYGTRLATAVLRDVPQGVRSAVIDGVLPADADFVAEVPANAQRGFDAVFEACAEETACSANFPDPLGALGRVLADLKVKPVVVDVEKYKVEVNPEVLMNVLFVALYDVDAIAVIPKLIDRMEKEQDFTAIARIYVALSGESQVSTGMYYSVVCSDEVPFSSPESVKAIADTLRPEFQAYFVDDGMFDLCDEWNVPAAAAVENEPIASDRATLVMSGSFDPITPPSWGEQAARTLSNSTLVEVKGQSHGASLSSCGSDIVRAFLKSPENPETPACLAAQRNQPFQKGGARHAPRFVVGELSRAELDGIAASVVERSRGRLKFRAR
jgi:pimeloyl-ACP methyl ester carboxylesterase